MRILIDENLPRKLVEALEEAGHHCESVHTLKLQGLDNGGLFAFAVQNFDLCLTRDFGFTHNAAQASVPAGFRLVRVNLPQQRQELFVAEFMIHFRRTEWSTVRNGTDWPL